MDKTFDEAIAGIRNAERGVEVREDIAQGMEYVKQYAEEVTDQQQAALQPPEQPAPRRKRPQQLQRAKAWPRLPPPARAKAHSQRPQTQRAREALLLLPKKARTGLRPP